MQSKCVSTKKVCSAIKFKQWAVSRHMMRSICTKSKCHVDGKKSVMILPGASEPSKTPQHLSQAEDKGDLVTEGNNYWEDDSNKEQVFMEAE